MTTEFYQKAKTAVVTYRLAVLNAAFYSIWGLGSTTLTALSGAKWATLDTQSKWMIAIGILTNWAGFMRSFLDRTMHNILNSQQSQQPQIPPINPP